MKIIVDGMGGDNAPQEIVKGTIQAASELAVSEPEVTVAIIGPEKLIQGCLEENGWTGSNIEVIDATEVITNHEAPAMAVRKKKDSTIVKAMRLIKEGSADALQARFFREAL